MLIHDAYLTGSFIYNGTDISDITGSEASVAALNQFTSSYNTGSFTGSFRGSGSGLNGVVSASFATTSLTSSFANNLTVTGTITAQTLNVQQVTSSVIFSSGSNVFGNSLLNTQVMTGSVNITGSLAVNGTTATLGTGTTNYLSKFTGASTIGNSTIQTDGSGNLMVGSANAGNAGTINVSVGVAGTTAGGLQLWAATNQTHFIQFGDGTTGAQVYAGYLAYAHSTDSLLFGTNGSDKMTLTSSGSLGLGVIPSAWRSGDVVIDLGATTSLVNAQSLNTRIYTNAFVASGGTNTYKTTNFATYYDQGSGQHRWFNAPSGTAGNAISFTQAMTLNASGNLGIGVTDPDIFSRGDARMVGIGAAGASDNLALALNAGGSGGRGAQIYMGQGGTRHFTISSNVTETRVGTTSSTPLILTTNDTTRLTIAASTGAATFSSSVTASGGASGVGFIMTNTTNSRQVTIGYTSGEAYNYIQAYDGTNFQ